LYKKASKYKHPFQHLYFYMYHPIQHYLGLFQILILPPAGEFKSIHQPIRPMDGTSPCLASPCRAPPRHETQIHPPAYSPDGWDLALPRLALPSQALPSQALNMKLRI
jgi:hypothetical protein